MQSTESTSVRHARAKVKLVAHTRDPFRLAVASARTCYAAEFVVVGSLDAKGRRSQTTLLEALPKHSAELDVIGNLDTPHDERVRLVEKIQAETDDATLGVHLAAFADLARQRANSDASIAHSIYEAGHHTPFQHPTFVFSLEGISRLAVESFFHNHTFYNSEQQSQRYVEMKHAEVHVPPLVAEHPKARAIYEGAVQASWEAYHDLRERLVASNAKVMTAIGKIKGQTEKAIVKEAEKKSQEMARYVVPVAAATQLYHTVSGIVLLRYLRMAQSSDAPQEVKAIVEAMVREVAEVDAGFFREIPETMRPRGEHVEQALVQHATAPRGHPRAKGDEPFVQLLHHNPAGEQVVLDTLREVTGSNLPDADLLASVLDPAQNSALADTLNTWDHSPVLRALRHVHLTFRKRLSLTAYAQDQRHRLTPGTRPLLRQCLTPEPDVHVPDVIGKSPDARRVFDDAIRGLWTAIAELRALGIPDDEVVYLLPNATNIHFTQSGDLLSFLHKWRLRTCFNAQKEIFDASIEELRLAQAVHPRLTAWMGPPCLFVAARQPADKQDDIAACCPEGPRWCGVKVWKNFDAAKGTPKRPF